MEVDKDRPPATAAQKAVSACFGAVATSLAITPLDVAKIRIQMQEPTLDAGAQLCASCGELRLSRPPAGLLATSMAECSQCTHYEVFYGGLSESLHPKTRNMWAPPHPNTAGYRMNTIEMLVALVRYEGVTSLWAGLPPTLVMSLPATVLYMMCYDELRSRIPRREDGSLRWWAPLLSGTSARAVAAAAVSPLELIRTQMQSGSWESSVGLLGGLHRTVARGGVAGLYAGLIPTLFRDIPFSGIYWTVFEANKRHLSTRDLPPFAVSFASGAAAGMLAAAVTTPFDVCKTRMQIAAYSQGRDTPRLGPADTMRNIIRTEGLWALTAGLGARVVKVAPACAIMISSYDMGKRFFGTSDI